MWNIENILKRKLESEINKRTFHSEEKFLNYEENLSLSSIKFFAYFNSVENPVKMENQLGQPMIIDGPGDINGLNRFKLFLLDYFCFIL